MRAVVDTFEQRIETPAATTAALRERKLTPGEVALLWGCSTKTVLRLISSGSLPAIRVTRKTILITKVDADIFYASKQTGLSSIGSIRHGGGRHWGT